jgi:hypothetical protein
LDSVRSQAGWPDRQWLQPAQLLAPHEPQPPPVPLTLWVLPPLLLLMAANSDSARDVAALPHAEQTMGASAWLMGRSLSNLT